MVNFMYQHDWFMGCPDNQSNIIMVVLARVFWDDIHIWISKADCPLTWALSNESKARIEQNGWLLCKEVGSPLPHCLGAGTFFFSCLWTWTETLALPRSQASWSLNWKYTIHFHSSQSFELWLKLCIVSFVPPVCCWLHILGVVSL